MNIKLSLILSGLCFIFIGISKGFNVAFIVVGTLFGLGMLCLIPFILAYFWVVWKDNGFMQALKECSPIAIIKEITKEEN